MLTLAFGFLLSVNLLLQIMAQQQGITEPFSQQKGAPYRRGGEKSSGGGVSSVEDDEEAEFHDAHPTFQPPEPVGVSDKEDAKLEDDNFDAELKAQRHWLSSVHQLFILKRQISENAVTSLPGITFLKAKRHMEPVVKMWRQNGRTDLANQVATLLTKIDRIPPKDYFNGKISVQVIDAIHKLVQLLDPVKQKNAFGKNHTFGMVRVKNLSALKLLIHEHWLPAMKKLYELVHHVSQQQQQGIAEEGTLFEAKLHLMFLAQSAPPKTAATEKSVQEWKRGLQEFSDKVSPLLHKISELDGSNEKEGKEQQQSEKQQFHMLESVDQLLRLLDPFGMERKEKAMNTCMASLFGMDQGHLKDMPQLEIFLPHLIQYKLCLEEFLIGVRALKFIPNFQLSLGHTFEKCRRSHLLKSAPALLAVPEAKKFADKMEQFETDLMGFLRVYHNNDKMQLEALEKFKEASAAELMNTANKLRRYAADRRAKRPESRSAGEKEREANHLEAKATEFRGHAEWARQQAKMEGSQELAMEALQSIFTIVNHFLEDNFAPNGEAHLTACIYPIFDPKSW